jgi:hypothetical protein
MYICISIYVWLPAYMSSTAKTFEVCVCMCSVCVVCVCSVCVVCM